MTGQNGAQTMEQSTSVHRFYVIKFLELPNVDIEEYVCVPDSWVILVLLQGVPEQQVKVGYPAGEARETTSDRVKREEKPWDEWNIYCAVITYITDSYDSARAWIRFNCLNLLSALDHVDVADTEVLESTSSSGSSGCSNRSFTSSSDESNLRMQAPLIKTNPSMEDQNFYQKQVVKVEVAGCSDDVSLPSTADVFKPVKVEAAEHIDYFSEASIKEENTKQTIDEVSYDNNQTCQSHDSKVPANSEDIDAYATLTLPQIPYALNQSYKYEPSGKKLLPSVIQGEQDGMNNSMIKREPAPPGHLHSFSSSSLSSSSVDQNHLAQEITGNRQSTGENYFNGQNEVFPLLESSKQGPFYSGFWKNQLQERVSKYISDSRSYITGNNVKGTPLTAETPSISTKQSLPLPLSNVIMNGRNKENVSLEILRQAIQDGIPNNKKDEVVDKKKCSQKNRNKKRRPSVSYIAFKYYVVQFKELLDQKMRTDKYVCVLNSWITSGLADIEADSPDMNFEVKVAYPADPRDIPLDFRKFPDHPLKDWRSYSAVVKHITGSYYAAKYWIEQKMGKSHAPVNNDSTDMGGKPPTAALESSGSSGSRPNLPSSDLKKLELALAHCMTQPGLTIKKCKRPATSEIDNKKRQKTLEASTAAYDLSSIADTPLIYENSHIQNRSGLSGKSVQAYDLKTQSIMSGLRTNSQQIPPKTQPDMNQRDFHQSVDNNRLAAQNIYSTTHDLPGHPHMWPNGNNYIPAYQGFTYQNHQSNPVNNYRNGRNLNSVYHYSRTAQSALNNPHLFDPREHSQHRPDINALIVNDNKQIPISAHVTNNNSTTCCLCNGDLSKRSSKINDIVNRLKIALLKEQINNGRPPEHSYE